MTDPTPFIIERYEDWSDYPMWVELTDDDLDESPSFATVAEARAWLDAYLDAMDEKSLAWWYEREERIKQGAVIHARRVALLEEAGLGHHPGIDYQGGPLHKPQESYKKPGGVDRKNYRVALDAVRCPTCGAHSSASQVEP